MCNGRIEHIKLKNYKCHRSFESDLKKLTILAGENSAGKSSVIQALLMQYLVFNFIFWR
jgi:predicted ATPase